MCISTWLTSKLHYRSISIPYVKLALAILLLYHSNSCQQFVRVTVYSIVDDEQKCMDLKMVNPLPAIESRYSTSVTFPD